MPHCFVFILLRKTDKYTARREARKTDMPLFPYGAACRARLMRALYVPRFRIFTEPKKRATTGRPYNGESAQVTKKQNACAFANHLYIIFAR